VEFAAVAGILALLFNQPLLEKTSQPARSAHAVQLQLLGKR